MQLYLSRKAGAQWQSHTCWAIWPQNFWMNGTCRVQPRKSMDMRYSSRVLPGPAGRQTCSWCRCERQEAALAPRSILPGCASPARHSLHTSGSLDTMMWSGAACCMTGVNSRGRQGCRRWAAWWIMPPTADAVERQLTVLILVQCCLLAACAQQ